MKRSNHPDFMYSSELKKIQFTGIRHNSILDTYEIWTLGDLRASMSRLEAELNPERWEALYSSVFGLDSVKVKKNVVNEKDKKED